MKTDVANITQLEDLEFNTIRDAAFKAARIYNSCAIIYVKCTNEYNNFKDDFIINLNTKITTSNNNSNPWIQVISHEDTKLMRSICKKLIGFSKTMNEFSARFRELSISANAIVHAKPKCKHVSCIIYADYVYRFRALVSCYTRQINNIVKIATEFYKLSITIHIIPSCLATSDIQQISDNFKIKTKINSIIIENNDLFVKLCKENNDINQILDFSDEVFIDEVGCKEMIDAINDDININSNRDV